MVERHFEYYLKNISRRWKREVDKATEKVIVLSPYITPKTAEIVLGEMGNIKCEIYTTFSLKNFLSGTSSLKTLKTLSRRGCQLYHLNRIHAKMIIIPGQFASIGSQNLTSGGVNNREASVVITDPQEVERIERLLEKWIEKYNPRSITETILEQVEGILPEIRVKHKEFYHLLRELNRETDEIEQLAWSQEEKRRQQEEQARNEKLRIEKEEKRRREEINHLIFPIEELFKDGELEFLVAQKFISKAVIQKTRNGKIITPAIDLSSQNLFQSKEGWVFALGQNKDTKNKGKKFLINKAIFGCKKIILRHLNDCLKFSNTSIKSSELIQKLNSQICCSVVDGNNNEFPDGFPLSPDDEDCMFCFGMIGISLSKFIDCLFETCNLI